MVMVTQDLGEALVYQNYHGWVGWAVCVWGTPLKSLGCPPGELLMSPIPLPLGESGEVKNRSFNLAD